MKKLIALLGWLSMSAAALAQTLTSPNGNLQMDFHLSADRTPVYSLTYKGKEVIKESRMGFRLRLAAEGPSYELNRDFRVLETRQDSADTT